MGITSSCCLMIDGKVVAAQQEERFTRIKNYDTWPKYSIRSCLEIAKINIKQVDKVVWAGKDPPAMDYFLTKRYSSYSFKDMIDEQENYWYPVLYKNKKINYLKLFKKKIDLNQSPGKKILSKYINSKGKAKEILKKNFKELLVVNELGLGKNKIDYIEHHDCHSYYSISNIINKKSKILTLTIDGSGDKAINCTVSIYNNRKLKRVFESKNFIIGRIYRHITLLLGMKWGEHEYKTMGLAPYSGIRATDETYRIFCKTFDVRINSKNVLFKDLKDCYFAFKEKLKYSRFDAIAGGVQKFAEDRILKWVNYWIKKTNIKEISYSGGVSMNVKVNKEIAEIKNLKSLNVPGAGTDDSLSIGACYAYANKKGLKTYPLKDLYLGYQISDLEILNTIKGLNKKKYLIKKNQKPEDISRLLSNGLILGRCMGRMEFGARALGNRSILADPRSFNTIEKINKKIKSRDFWMPFAPSVVENHANKYFYLKKNVNYTQMTVCVETKKEYKKIIPAVLHPSDFTARIHLVKKELNIEYFRLINSFYKLTKIGILLNTSLNLHGRPIARTAADCMEILENSEIDGIEIENYLILKKNIN